MLDNDKARETRNHKLWLEGSCNIEDMEPHAQRQFKDVAGNVAAMLPNLGLDLFLCISNQAFIHSYGPTPEKA